MNNTKAALWRTAKWSDPLEDHSVTTITTHPTTIQSIFENHEDHLLQLIGQADAVVGCIAWLTQTKLVEALAEKDCVSIVVQKEDFLRPEQGTNWHKTLKTLYKSLPEIDFGRFHVPGLAGYNYCSDPEIEAIRCAGETNTPSAARCHHKFVVFLRRTDPNYAPRDSFACSCRTLEPMYRGDQNPQVVCRKGCDEKHNNSRAPAGYQPTGVWTGSYNWSKTASKSRENAVYLTDRPTCEAFLGEWRNTLIVSESLNWDFEYIAPEWREGS